MTVRETPAEVAIANLAFIAFWLLTVAGILLAGHRWPRARDFRHRMLAQWRPSLAIAALFLTGLGLGGRGILNPYALAVFCQALVGLALARSVPGFEPLPAVQALLKRERVLRTLALVLVVAFLAAAVAIAVGSIGMGIVRQVFGEVSQAQEAREMLPQGKVQVFFLLLAGAGIAEETVYRLVCLSFLWRLTRRRSLAILGSALLFALYHLTPLDSMYRVFWGYPISQFLASAAIGLIWGYVYVKRGYETAVLAHTLSNWLPFLLFAA